MARYLASLRFSRLLGSWKTYEGTLEGPPNSPSYSRDVALISLNAVSRGKTAGFRGDIFVPSSPPRALSKSSEDVEKP